jgi:hypothetical protein
VTIAALAAALAAGVAARAAPPPVRTVPCDEIAGLTPSGTDGDYRIVLGVVSVPPAYLEQVVPTHERPWAYWRKAGLVVRSGSPTVTISVPRAWRSRVAIVWGNRSVYAHTLRIARCGSNADVWHGYAGGFYLRSSSACVPLVFRVGRRSTTVRFGVGKPCG